MTIEEARTIIANMIQEFGDNIHDMEYQMQLDYDPEDWGVLFEAWNE